MNKQTEEASGRDEEIPIIYDKDKSYLLIERKGLYYHVNDHDAIILTYLMRKRLETDLNILISDSMLNNIIKVLNDNKIDYKINFNKENKFIDKKNGDLNNYHKILNKTIKMSGIDNAPKVRVKKKVYYVSRG